MSTSLTAIRSVPRRLRPAALAAVALAAAAAYFALPASRLEGAPPPPPDLGADRLSRLERLVADQARQIAQLRERVESAQADASSVAGLAPLAAYVRADTIDGRPAVVFGGCNVYVQNAGKGVASGTSCMNGLGNLTLGYDEQCPGVPRVRTGSHNIILGTSYHDSYATVYTFAPECTIPAGCP